MRAKWLGMGQSLEIGQQGMSQALLSVAMATATYMIYAVFGK